MSGQSSAVTARVGDNRFLRTVAAISTLAGWCSAVMIVSAVVIISQIILLNSLYILQF